VARILVVADEPSPSLERAVAKEKLNLDLVISCGDLPYDYLEFLVDALDVPLFYVHGNHDRPVITEEGLLGAPRGATLLEGRVARRAGLLLAGLGGSPRYLPSGAHQFWEWEMAWRVRKLELRLIVSGVWRTGLDIWVTHAPPRGVHDGPDPAHQGFSCFLGFLRRWRPRFMIHGHAAPRPGLPQEAVVGSTRVIFVRGYRFLEVAHARA